MKMRNKFLTGLVMSALVSSMSYAVMADSPATTSDSSTYATKSELLNVEKTAADAYSIAVNNEQKIDELSKKSGSSTDMSSKANQADVEKNTKSIGANTAALVKKANVDASNIDDDAWANKLHLVDMASAIKTNSEHNDTLAAVVDHNKTAIDTNTEAIRKNTAGVKDASMLADTALQIGAANGKAIKANQDAISMNKKDIKDANILVDTALQIGAANGKAIKANQDAISMNKKDIKDASMLADTAVQIGAANAKAIKDNQDAIAADKATINLLNKQTFKNHENIDKNSATLSSHTKSLVENEKAIHDNEKAIHDNMGKIGALETMTDIISGTVGDQGKAIEDNAKKIAENSKMVEEAQGYVEQAHKAQVKAAQSQEMALKSKMAAHESEMAAAKAAASVQASSTKIQENSDRIDLVEAGTAGLSETVGDHELRIQNLETFSDTGARIAAVNAKSIKENQDAINSNKKNIEDLSDTVETHGFAIKGLKNNKVDKTDYEVDKKDLNDKIDTEIKTRKSHDKIIMSNFKNVKMLADTALQIGAANGKAIKANQDAISMNKKDIKDASMLADTALQIGAANGKAIKANQDAIAMKADKADLDATNAKVDTKADDAATKAALDLKADKTALADLSTKAKATDDGLHATKAELGAFEMSTKSEFSSLRKDVKNTGSLSAALGALQVMPYVSGERAQILVGVGNYKGATSAALGLTYNVNRNINVHGGVAFGSGSDSMYSLGASFRIGGGTSEVVTPEVATEQINGMESRIETLEQQNAELRQQVQELLAKMSAK